MQVSHSSTSAKHPRILLGNPSGNMELASADSSFLEWDDFFRRRVLKLGSLLEHQGAVRWHMYCRKLKHTTTTTTAKSMRCSRLFVHHHRRLESLATAICRDTVSDTPREHSSSGDDMYNEYWARHILPPVWGSKPVLASSGTDQNWCLISSRQAISGRTTENIIRDFCFLAINKIR